MNLWLPEGGRVRKFGMDMHTLLYFKRVTDKDLLCNTGSSAQCCVAAWMRGGLEGNGHMCMYG